MAGFWAHGTTVTVDSQLVGGLTEISLPDQSRGDVETTDHDSGGDREFVAGLRDNGTVTLGGRLIPQDPGQLNLRDNFSEPDAVVTVVITLPSQANPDPSHVSTYTFSGYVSSLGGDLPGDSDEPGSFSATVKVTGAVTLATV